MYEHHEPSLVPRNGHTLIAGIVARISGCANQKEMSLDDQIDHAKEEITQLFAGPVQFRTIATKGKGERLDRPELAQIEAELCTRELDLFVFEDLGRLVRGPEAVRLLGVGVDHGTRGIVPNDEIDTNDANWEEAALSACREHVSHQSHTSKRLKQKLLNRFVKFGGATARPVAGYIVPPDAKTYDDWQKDVQATPKIAEGLHRLRETRNHSAVAEWFNTQGFPTGPYCRSDTWTGKMVKRFYAKTVLKGMPGRGFRHTVKVYGRVVRVSVKNPRGPQFRDCPHLAHVNAAEFDEVNALLAVQNARYRRPLVDGRDPRESVPRKRTVFPAQHGACWYCGRRFVRGGNGVTENLMCPGVREWRCWNSIGFNGNTAVKKVVAAITGPLYLLDGFERQFRNLVELAAREAAVGDSDHRRDIQHKQEALEREKANLLAAIMQYGMRPMFAEKLSELETGERALKRELHELETDAGKPIELPGAIVEFRELFERHFERLAASSWEFGQLMETLVPAFRVYLVRLCDGGHLMPRAMVRITLDGVVPDAKHEPMLSEVLTREMMLDLFTPPQRERIREQAVTFAAQGLTCDQIAARLPEPVTATAVQRALKLQRTMEQLRIGSPYVTVLEPPADYTKLRRHKNRKFRFTPLGGYQPPPL